MSELRFKDIVDHDIRLMPAIALKYHIPIMVPRISSASFLFNTNVDYSTPSNILCFCLDLVNTPDLSVEDYIPRGLEDNDSFLGVDRNTDRDYLSGIKKETTGHLDYDLEQLFYAMLRDGANPDYIVSKSGIFGPSAYSFLFDKRSVSGIEFKCIIEPSLKTNDIFLITSSTWHYVQDDLRKKSHLVCNKTIFNGRLIME